MPIVVNTNVNSLLVQRSLSSATVGIGKSLERLSTGLKINSAADDAAGLTISEKLKAQERGYATAQDNAQNGINMLQTAEGDLSTIQDNLQRMRDLAVTAANDTNGADERTAIKAEIDERVAEITKIASGSKFNGIALLDGTQDAAGTIKLQIGANTATNDVLDISGAFTSANAAGLAISALTVDTNANATTSITAIDTAIKTVSTQRSKIGSYVNSISSAIDSSSIRQANLASAGSRIRDVDVAKEAAMLTKNQILQQASATLLAQANASPQVALSLI